MFYRFLFFISLGWNFLATACLAEKPIVIIVPSFNNIRWVERNLLSLINQEYTNYRIIYIDDCSEDGTYEQVLQILNQYSSLVKTEIKKNSIRQGALKNIYEAVCCCEDDEIIVTVDGDDGLARKDVLKIINEVYSSKDEVWLTHGSYVTTKGVKGISTEIPKNVIQNHSFRKHAQPSHLRTFYTWLFKKIKLEDLQYKGEFFPVSWDVAMMIPMLEMASERHAYIPHLLYIYNDQNPINDHRINAEKQLDLYKHIKLKKPYPRLESR